MPSTLLLPPIATPPLPEATLVDRARRGDQDAFAALMARYERQIFAVTVRMLGDADDAADIAQETFVRAYRALGTTGADLQFAAWLHRIAANACLDVLRRRQRLRWQPWDGAKHDHLVRSDPTDDPERAAVGAEAHAAVRRALARVSPRHRRALTLRAFEGLTCDEIGAAMGLSRAAVKSLLYRARRELRAIYVATEQPVVAGRS